MLPILILSGLSLVPRLDNVVPLDALDISGMSSGYNEPHKLRSCEDRPLTIGGKVFASGVGTHALSEYAIRLGGKALAFDASVGIDDETEGRGSVRFILRGDGKQLADSGVLKGGQAAYALHASLKGVRILKLIVDDGGDGIDYDHADWGDAKLTMLSGAKPSPVVVSNEPPMKIAHGVSPRTQIHGARIVGCTPGCEFLFLIPATGAGPLQYSASGLPDGLALDPNKGVIRGSIAKAGQYDVWVSVKGPKGTDTRKLRIVAGWHKLALTPPMGWNSWNVWAGAVDASKIRAAADSFLATGLAGFGYNYVNIDDCWEAGRDADGQIQANAKFGDMTSLAAYVHGLGLKVGLYSSPGPKTCAGFTASYQHEAQDAKTYAQWGFDYLKYDWCSYGQIAPNPDLPAMQKPYIVMRQGLDDSGRDIVFSLCQYGMGDVYKWGKSIGGNLWRTTGDIVDNWNSMTGNGFCHDIRSPYVRPGGWNDPDMLVVGRLGWGPNPHPTHLKPNEQITHITLWSLLAAPLIIGCDLTQIDSFTADLLMNHDVIEVDQDPLGRAAVPVLKQDDVEIWARPLFDGTMAVGLFNRGPEHTKVTLNWSVLGLEGQSSQPVRDIWLEKDLGKFAKNYATQVPGHGAVFLKIGQPLRKDL